MAKLPKNYQIVLDVVESLGAGTHATTSRVFEEARRVQPRIGHSTVYRALDRLCDLGLVLEVRVPGGSSALYEPVRANHAHFVCTRCGGVDDIDHALSPSSFDAIAQARDVVVEEVSLTLHGLCGACRRARDGLKAPSTPPPGD